MKLSYTITKQDYVNALKSRPEYTRRVEAMHGCFATSLIGMLLYLVPSQIYHIEVLQKICETLFLVFAGACLFSLWNFPYFKIAEAVKHKLPANFFGAHFVDVSGTVLTLNQGGIAKKLPCRGLRCEVAPGGVLIYAGSTMIEFVPRAAFASWEERDCFIKEIDEAGRLAEDLTQMQTEKTYSVSFEWEREPFVEAIVALNWRSISTREFWTAGRIALTALTEMFGVLCVFAALKMDSIGFAAFAILMGVSAVTLPFARVIIALPALIRSTTRTRIKQGGITPDIFMQQSVFFGETEILNCYTARDRVTLWPQVTRCSYYNGTLIITIEDKLVLLIPGQAFKSDAQRDEILAYIRQNMEKWHGRCALQ